MHFKHIFIYIVYFSKELFKSMARKLSHYILEEKLDNDNDIENKVKKILNDFFKNSLKVSKETDFEMFKTESL